MVETSAGSHSGGGASEAPKVNKKDRTHEFDACALMSTPGASGGVLPKEGPSYADLVDLAVPNWREFDVEALAMDPGCLHRAVEEYLKRQAEQGPSAALQQGEP